VSAASAARELFSADSMTRTKTVHTRVSFPRVMAFSVQGRTVRHSLIKVLKILPSQEPGPPSRHCSSTDEAGFYHLSLVSSTPPFRLPCHLPGR
jgi:hypothetical protein